MHQLFSRFPKFAEITQFNESPASFRKKSNVLSHKTSEDGVDFTIVWITVKNLVELKTVSKIDSHATLFQPSS